MAKILIAEDEFDTRELISFTLKHAGHEVISTQNGEEAIKTIETELPDLVLLDIRMPRKSGYEVCKLIKEGEETKHIPVLFLSAKDQEIEIIDGMQAGADAYILKPFSPDNLIQQISVYLNDSLK